MRKPKLGFFTDRKGNKIYMRNLVGKEVSFKGILTPDIVITQSTKGKIVEVMTYQTGEVVNPTIKIEFYNQLYIRGGADNHLLDGSHLGSYVGKPGQVWITQMERLDKTQEIGRLNELLLA